MAFRPTSNLIEGLLDNTTPGHVKGWIDFVRKGKLPLHCVLDLEGDFLDDIRGRVLHIWKSHPTDVGYDGSLGRREPTYMETMHTHQLGKAGHITARHPEAAYIEWYSHCNGRVVLDVPAGQFELLGHEVDVSKLPPRKTNPGLFQEYLRTLSVALRKTTKDPNALVLGVGSQGVRPPEESKRN